MPLSSRAVEGEEDNVEEGAEVEEVVVVEGEYQYHREQSFSRVEKRNRQPHRKVQPVKELPVLQRVQAEPRKKVTMLRVKTAEN